MNKSKVELKAWQAPTLQRLVARGAELGRAQNFQDGTVRQQS